MNILYLGNSITLHAPAPEIGWHGEWGMAASAPENDYVHVLNRLISQTGKFVAYKAENIAFVEREPERFCVDSFEKYVKFTPDLIVIRIGENVPCEKAEPFGKAYRSLLAYFLENTGAKIYAVGSFWRKDEAERQMMAAAEETGVKYVSLAHLQGTQWQAVGAYTHAGVASHPSDKGMQRIAETIFAAAKEDLLFERPVVSAVPAGEPVYDGIDVRVDGVSVDCYAARVSAIPFNRVWPGHQRPTEQTEFAPFLSLELKTSADFCVNLFEKPEDVTIRPLSKGVKPLVRDGKVFFTIREPGQYSVEINGRHRNLHIFADPEERGVPDSENATYYFPPGVHHPEKRIVLQSGESVYLARGAVVYGEIESTDANNVRIFGRGILDGSLIARDDKGDGVCDVRADGLVHFTRCKNIVMDGVILRDSALWTVTPINCECIRFTNVKVIGMWRYNSDGFDFVNSRSVRVADCFLRTYDDTVVIKGLYFPDGDRSNEKMNNENYLIENCVLWCDWGGALEVGAETVCDEYRNITYRNCDIIRNADGAMRLHCGDRAFVHDVLYDNIRIEYSKYDTKSIMQDTDEMVYDPPKEPNHKDIGHIWMYCGMWSPDNIPGLVRDVTYRNISIITDPEVDEPVFCFDGADAEHDINGVTIENVRCNGNRYLPRVVKNQFAKNIKIG